MTEAMPEPPDGAAKRAGARIRVAMLVANGCVRDARVIKEAESLAGNGHLVRVLCLAEEGLPPFEVRNDVAYERCELPQRRVAALMRRTGEVAGKQSAPREPASPAGPALSRNLVRRLKTAAGPFLEHELIAAAFVGRAAQFRPEVVHAHDFNVLPAALRIASRTGASVVYDMHEMEEARLPQPGPVLTRMKNAIEAHAIRQVAATITVSPSIAGHYARKHGIEHPTLVLNAPRVSPGRRLAETVRERARIPRAAPLAVYTGVLAEGRGNEHMLDAIAMLDDVHLAIVGPVRPAMIAHLDRVRADARTAARIHLLEPVPHEDVVPFIASADVGLCTIAPSCLNYEYCLPNKLFEMTFAGLPLVVSRNVELQRFVLHARNGVAVPADDPIPLAGAIRHVLALRERYAPDPARLAELIEAFDWRAQERTLLSLYDRVLSKRALTRNAA